MVSVMEREMIDETVVFGAINNNVILAAALSQSN